MRPYRSFAARNANLAEAIRALRRRAIESNRRGRRGKDDAHGGIRTRLRHFVQGVGALGETSRARVGAAGVTRYDRAAVDNVCSENVMRVDGEEIVRLISTRKASRRDCRFFCISPPTSE